MFGSDLGGMTQDGGMMQGPQMSLVAQILQQMRGNRPQQQGGGNGLMGMMPLLMAMMGGGATGQMTPGAQQIGQQGLGMANQSPLSLFNPNY